MKEVIVPADDLVCIGKEKLQEVIRCRECRYYRWNDCFAEITREDGKKYYTSYIDSPSEDDYCSRAERKEECQE